MLVVITALAGPVRADVTVRVVESSWSVGRNPPRTDSVVETAIKAGMRRVETLSGPTPGDSTGRAAHSIQVDRLDRDSSFYFRPGDSLYLPVPLAAARASNRKNAQAFAAAQANGTAPHGARRGADDRPQARADHPGDGLQGRRARVRVQLPRQRADEGNS
jgi:hypothetical protein